MDAKSGKSMVKGDGPRTKSAITFFFFAIGVFNLIVNLIVFYGIPNRRAIDLRKAHVQEAALEGAEIMRKMFEEMKKMRVAMEHLAHHTYQRME